MGNKQSESQCARNRVEEAMIIKGKSPSAFPLLSSTVLQKEMGLCQRDSSGLELRGYAKGTVVECSYC